MKILLIYPLSCDLLHNESLPLGLISIGTYLKNSGHEVKILDLSVEQSSVKRILSQFKPDICGISVRSSKQISSAMRISKTIKKTGCTVVWGGPFISTVKLEHLFQDGIIDIVSFGEGEMTWVDLANSFENNRELSEVKGIAFKENNVIITTDKRDFLDLENILPCDWSLVDVNKYFLHMYGAKKLVYLYMSKGCPGHCAFCYNEYFHDSCIRRKSLDVFMTELYDLVNNYGVDGFYLADEFAFSHKKDLYKLCSKLDESDLKLIWGFETRIGHLNEEDFVRAYDSGCRCIHFGVETASKRMLDIIGKNIPFEKVIPTFELCNRIGIIPVSTFIVGMPGESVEDLKETVNFINIMPSNEISVMIYTYIHNSRFGKNIYESGKFPLPEKLKDYKRCDVYHSKLPSFSEIPMSDLKVIQGYFFWKLLFKKDYKDYPGDEKGYVVLYKHIEIALKRALKINILNMPESISRSFFPFIRFFIAANFCKKTLRKYGLY